MVNICLACGGVEAPGDRLRCQHHNPVVLPQQNRHPGFWSGAQECGQMVKSRTQIVRHSGPFTDRDVVALGVLVPVPLRAGASLTFVPNRNVVGRDSSVGIATRYGLDGQWIDTWCGVGGGDIFHTRPDRL